MSPNTKGVVSRRNKMADNQKVLQCYFCGNSTLMNMVGEHRHYWDEGGGYYGHFNYRMYSCPVCGKVTLFQQYWDVAQRGYCNGEEEDYTQDEILYPTNTFQGEYLPEAVQAAYEAALKTKNIDFAVCLIALRRTLEIICKEKGAEGRDLWKKIEDLSKKGVLPPELKHASTITKAYGNMGAHDTDISIRKYELEQIIDFVRYILDYLYILPAKLNAIQEQMEKRKPKTNKD